MDPDRDAIRPYNLPYTYTYSGHGLANKLTRAILSNPTCSNAYQKLGTLFMDQGKLDQAAKYFLRAFYLDPQCSYNLVYCLLRLERYQEVLELTRKFIEMNSSNEAYFLHGYELVELEKYEEAIEIFDKPGDYMDDIEITHQKYCYWAKALEGLEKYDEAIEKVTVAWKLKPSRHIAKVEYGINLYRKQDYEFAIDRYQWAEQMSYSTSHLWYNYGLACLQVGREKEATEMFVKGVEDQSENIYDKKAVLRSKLREIERWKKKLATEGVSKSFANHLQGMIRGLEEIVKLLQDKIKQSEA